MNKLIIVESVKKAPLISSLVDGYQVIASKGHVRRLPSKTGSVLPEEDFKMIWEVSNPAVVKNIIECAKKADLILLATDPDREGEAIGGHIATLLQENNIHTKILRIKFNSLEKNAILDAIAHPTELDQDLINAYFARLGLDYLVGFELSPFLWRKLPGSRSAGRVQSVCLRILVDREKEIAAFKPQDYWIISGSAENVEFELSQWQGKKFDRFLSEIEAQEAVTELQQRKDWIVSDILERTRSVKPSPPFITATLQQEASNKLGFRPSDTMSLAQQLYEGVRVNGQLTGLITYLRTDSVHVHENAIKQCREVIQDLYDTQYLPTQPNIYASRKKAQQAHEAIRPTNYTLAPAQICNQLEPKLAKLYRLIWERAVASQMAAAQLTTTTIQVKSQNEILETKASYHPFLGFKILYNTDDNTKTNLPFQMNSPVSFDGLTSIYNTTKPPRRYSEASIIQELEKCGIGRPSTYDKIITILQSRGYVRRENKSLIVEDRGLLVIALLEKWFKKYVENEFTASIEEQLDQVAEGQILWKSVLQAFWNDFHALIDQNMNLKPQEIQDAIHNQLNQYVISETNCPTCKTGSPIVKYSKNGGFIGCNNYPDCTWIRPMTSSYKVLHTDGEENVVLKHGPYGLYALWEKSQKKITIPRNFKEEQVTWGIVQAWAQLPKYLGQDESGNDISIGIGQFGLYVMRKNLEVKKPEYRHLNAKTNLDELTLADAIIVLNKEKRVRKTSDTDMPNYTPRRAARGRAALPKKPVRATRSRVVKDASAEDKPVRATRSRAVKDASAEDKPVRVRQPRVAKSTS